MTDRIVITGAAVETGLGPSVATWRGILDGRSALGEDASPRADAADGAGDRAGDGAGETIEVRSVRSVVRSALAESGLDARALAALNVGVVMGTTLHGIRGAGRYLRTGDARQLGQVPGPYVLRDALRGLPIRGPRLTTCSACSSGLSSVALGVTLLRSGVIDAAIVGGYDPEAEYSAAGFWSLRLVGARARPFCRGREGLRLGPGYAALVLERGPDAEGRGAAALAGVLGCGESVDAFHLTRPHNEGAGAVRAMRDALRAAGIEPGEIDLITAHATGTPANDAAEFAAMGSVFGPRLRETPVVALKSHLGHTLGAAGAVELALTLRAMREGLIPPTAGVSPEELEFDGLDLVTGDARPARIRVALNLSTGFGGANACVVLGPPGAAPAGGDAPGAEVAVTGVGLLAPGAIGNGQLLGALGRPAPSSVPGGAIPREAYAPLLASYGLRRQSEYSRLTIAAAHLALECAGARARTEFTSGCGAILGTAHGSVEYSEAYYREIVENGPEAGNPMLFAEGVPNAGAAQLSIAFGIEGACQTILGSRSAGLEALALAALRIARGEWPRAVVGAADEFSETVNAGYEACGLTGARAGASGGFIAGSGAGAVILERADAARARGATILATLEASSLTHADSEDAGEVEERAREALAGAGAGAEAGAVIGSASGIWIDRVERAAARRSGLGYESMASWLPEMFAAGPLVRLGAGVLRGRAGGRAGRVTGLCIDPFGPIAAVTLRIGG